MKNYNELKEKEKAQLLKFPAYISLLASTVEEEMDKDEKAVAVKLTHVKTFSSHPLLADYYKDAEKVFEQTITALNQSLPHNRVARMDAIHEELSKLEDVLKKLDPYYRALLLRSMQSYKHYVSRAHRNVLEYFLFPMPINGISD